MFFVISKVLYFAITPLFWIVVMLFLAIIFKKSSLKKKFGIICLLLLVFFSNNFIFTTVSRLWEVEPIKASTIQGKYEYGVVLGGMASANPKTGIIKYSASIDRLLKGIELYKNGTIKKIVITGGSGLIIHKGQKEALQLKATCLMLGVNEQDLILESESKNTHENALFTKHVIGVQSKIILITSGFHMRRSVGCFENEGFSVVAYATDPLASSILGPDDYFMPKAEPLDKWNYLIKEWIGYISYKIAGYI
jgi:uncharacterized SAM-binding protein YcdF (DUF218 family)